MKKIILLISILYLSSTHANSTMPLSINPTFLGLFFPVNYSNSPTLGYGVGATLESQISWNTFFSDSSTVNENSIRIGPEIGYIYFSLSRKISSNSFLVVSSDLFPIEQNIHMLFVGLPLFIPLDTINENQPVLLVTGFDFLLPLFASQTDSIGRLNLTQISPLGFFTLGLRIDKNLFVPFAGIELRLISNIFPNPLFTMNGLAITIPLQIL